MGLFSKGKTAGPGTDPAVSTHTRSATEVSPAPGDDHLGNSGPIPTPANQKQAVIVALAAVTVQVWEEKSDGGYGKVLLPETALKQGDSRPVPFAGPLYIQASAGEKLRIDLAGKSFFPAEKGVKGNQAFELK
jgi:hypothetical protein